VSVAAIGGACGRVASSPASSVGGACGVWFGAFGSSGTSALGETSAAAASPAALTVLPGVITEFPASLAPVVAGVGASFQSAPTGAITAKSSGEELGSAGAGSGAGAGEVGSGATGDDESAVAATLGLFAIAVTGPEGAGFSLGGAANESTGSAGAAAFEARTTPRGTSEPSELVESVAEGEFARGAAAGVG